MREIKADSKDAIIDIIGVIGWEVWYPAMRDMLKTIPDTVERVIFDIYSPGGDVWEGNGIIQEIGKLKQNTVARVQVAASMATLIAVACKEREIAANGRWLIHNPWTALAGDAATLEKRAKELRDCEMEAAGFYAVRTGKKPEDMLALMNEERWLAPQETLDLGFVQKINDPFDQATYAGVKAEIMAAGKWPMALAELPEENKQAEKEAVKKNEQKIELPTADVKPEEKKNDNAVTPGSEVKTDVKSDLPAKPADEKPDQKTVEHPGNQDAGYTRGFADAEVAGELERSKQIAEITAQLVKRDELIRKLQSEKDKALADVKAGEKKAAEREAELQSQITKLKDAVKDANERHAKLLSGGLTFTPAGPETWEEVMQAPGFDYSRDVKLYPKLRDEYNERKKRN